MVLDSIPRSILVFNDSFLLQTRVNLFEPIITVFVQNGEKYNLLNSVILEMFTFIHFNGMRILIDYFMETQFHRVEDVDYDSTFQLMKDKWERMHERNTETGIATDQLQAKRLQKDPRALDRGDFSLHLANKEKLGVVAGYVEQGISACFLLPL